MTEGGSKLTGTQTARKTLEEIDYIFVKGEARDRLQDRMHEQVQELGRHSTSQRKVVEESQTLELISTKGQSP
jgi:hypothetical protein